MFERYTERARQVVVLAQDEARQLKHNYIGAEHLLLGLLREEEGLGYRVLSELGITLDDARQWIKEKIGEGEILTPTEETEIARGKLAFTPRAKKILELSLREALSLGHNYIGTEHILLGLAREPESMAAKFLRQRDVSAERVRQDIIKLLSGRPKPGQYEIRRIKPEQTVSESIAELLAHDYKRGWVDGYNAALREIKSTQEGRRADAS